jgi:hypothetical protein
VILIYNNNNGVMMYVRAVITIIAIRRAGSRYRVTSVLDVIMRRTVPVGPNRFTFGKGILFDTAESVPVCVLVKNSDDFNF